MCQRMAHILDGEPRNFESWKTIIQHSLEEKEDISRPENLCWSHKIMQLYKLSTENPNILNNEVFNQEK